ncbi:ABC transporter ATP-binding protein [Methylobacter sp.]|uniref:ABC transporter ATP-binding protein n=1 Tax=Methylobacter sp. TaxID=2051955 RepID=UPI002FDD4830
MNSKIACRAIGKTYGEGELAETVLRGVDLQVNGGEACILLGPSGSGKTTLLSIIGCLSTPSSGTLELMGKPVDFSRNDECVRIRRHALGFVFQQAQLLPFLTAQQNVILTAENTGLSTTAAEQRCAELFRQLDIDKMAHKKPGLLSGGQRQRVAISRALIHKPAIVLADEPTAALDWRHGQAVIDLLIEQTRDVGAALVVVCHDQRLVPRFDRVFTVDNGRVIESI